MDELILECENMEIESGYGSKKIRVTLNQVNNDDFKNYTEELVEAIDDDEKILNHIDFDRAIDCYKKQNENMFDHLTKEECMEHYNLIEK